MKTHTFMEIAKKTNSPFILVKAYEMDENNFYTKSAFVEIEKNDIKMIQDMKKSLEELKEKHEYILEIRAAWSAMFTDYEEIDKEDLEKIDSLLEKSNYLQIEKPDLSEVAILSLSTSFDFIIVDDYGVRFESVIRYSSITVKSRTIPFSVIDSIEFE